MKKWTAALSRIFALLLCLSLVSACGTPTKTASVSELTPTPTSLPATPTTALPSSTPTPAQPKLLSLCTGQEPSSLFIYADTSPGAQAVYQAIYDGPVDTRNYQDVPVIFEKLPSLENGGITFEPVEIKPGDTLIDADGNWQTLAVGVRYYPTGCHKGDCALGYSGTDPISIDSMVIRFTLNQRLTWSDGTPLTASDSVYSYQVARELFPAYRPDLINITASYQALDSITIEWRGVPGFQGGLPDTYYFHPLPAHALNGISAQDLFTSEAASRVPLGWGAYTIQEWVPGDHITLQKNPKYFRASEGLPAFENLVVRFVDSSRSGIDALLAGECDLIDETVHVEEQAEEITKLVKDEKAVLFTSPETGWELLMFGIQPYDAARPAPFSDSTVRQAAAYCIDRQALAASIPGAQVMDTYVMPGDPLFNNEVDRYPVDIQKASSLLEAAGWMDADANASTPRVNATGSALSITYLVPDDPLRTASAALIKSSLESCGFQVNMQSLPWDQLMASGPEGQLFGRSFDLAQLGWSADTAPACSLYLSSEIPGPYPEYTKGWGGANASGFQNPDFDAACRLAQLTLPGPDAYQQAQLQAQAIFAKDLPSLPLYSYSSFALARPDLCGIEPAAGTTLLWNLEAVNYGPACGK